MAPAPETADFSLTDEELRASGRLKWSVYPDDVLPAWVADMDVRPSAEIVEAIRAAAAAGLTTYPAPAHRTGLPRAFAQFQAERFGWQVDPARVVLVGDVVGGLDIALRTLCEPGPIALPVPNYWPFYDLARYVGRDVLPVRHAVDASGRLTLDLDELDAAFAAGARVLLLSHPQNPLGRAFTAEELTAWIGCARRYGARILSDEIWGPLTLDPPGHVPAGSLPGAEDCVTTVTSPAKSFNVAGTKSAVVIAGSAADARTLSRLTSAVNHGTASLGIAAAVAAYTHGGPWLDSLLGHLRTARDTLERLVDERLPGVSLVHPEATFLAWLDVSSLGLDDPYRSALDRGKVALSPGKNFFPDGFPDGAVPGSSAGRGTHVRLNFGTTPERLERIVGGLARAWYG